MVQKTRAPGVRREMHAIRFEAELWAAVEEEAARRSVAAGVELGASEVLRALVRERIAAVEAETSGPEHSAVVRAAILSEFTRLEKANRGYVPIFEIRRAVRASRENFDRALLDLHETLYLTKINDPRDVPRDQIADGLMSPIRGRLFYVSRI